jgi:hypothetical protein
MSDPTDPIAQLIAKWRQEVLRNKPGLFYRAITRCADELDALRAQRTEGRRCDCGAALTQCSDCAVGDYQAAHIDCRTCCPVPIERTEGRPPEEQELSEMNIIDPSSERGQQIMADRANEQPTTQGDPPPEYDLPPTKEWYRQRCEWLNEYNEEKNHTIADLKSKTEALFKQRNQLEAQVADLQSQIETLTADLARISDENDRICQLNDQLTAEGRSEGRATHPICRASWCGCVATHGDFCQAHALPSASGEDQ